MSLLQRRRPNRLDEPQILARIRAAAADVPPVLTAGPREPWVTSVATRARLLEALDLYGENEILLRSQQVEAPRWTPDLHESRRLIHLDRVRLKGDDGAHVDVTIPDLLDANVLFALVARFLRSWEVRPPHAWTEWDLGVAWAEETQDPHGGQLDLPDAFRAGVYEDHPLFGWRLDLAWGARVSAHGVPVVRTTHALVAGHRTVPLFDLPKCFHRGQSPFERIKSRSLRSEHGPAAVVSLDVADRRVELQPPGVPEPISASLDVVLRLNPDVAPMLGALRDQELVELRRRLEAHAAARKVWVADPGLREVTGLPQLPLSGWQLATDAFAGLDRGEVRLAHPRVPEGLTVSARAAWRMMVDDVDPALRLRGDPCSDGAGGAGFLRDVLPQGCRLTRGHDDDPQHSGWIVGHAAFLRANPDLAEALLRERPDLGLISEDPQLRGALRERLEDGLTSLEPLAELLAAPAPFTTEPLARLLAAELLDRPDLDVPLRVELPDRGEWVWSSMTDEGRFRLVRSVADAHLRLDGPVGAGAVLDAAPPPDELRLTAEQLVFAHLPLARRVAAWQRDSGLLDADGRPVDAGTRLAGVVRRASQALDDAHLRTRQHIRLSRELREDPRRARSLEAHLERLEANLADLRAGNTARAFIDDTSRARFGLAVAAGGAGGGGNRALDDRLRVNDFVDTRYLGPLRLILVAGGDSAYEVPAGPLITRLLDDVEQRAVRRVRDAVDPDEAASALRDVILEASAAAGRPTPFCSLVAALLHPASGRTTVLWCGNAAAWRVRGDRSGVERVTWDHTADGMVQLCRAAGLSEPDAVAALLQLSLRKVTRRDLDALPDDQLAAAAERFGQPARRRALRAGLGGGRAAMFEEHDRVLSLLRTWQDALPTHVDLSPVEDGAGMVFVRRLRIRPGDRLVFASDGLTGLIERQPLLTLRALTRPEPQRAAEWLVDLTAADTASDDLAVVIIDPLAERPWWPTHARRQGVVHRRTLRQDDVLDGGIVPPLADGSLPALRFRPRQLARFEAEIDDLLRKRRLPAPEQDLEGFVEGLARWACNREAERPHARRPGEELRELDEVLDERDDDPMDEVAICFWLLRRRRVPVIWRCGVRAPRGARPADPVQRCTWLELSLRGVLHVVDVEQRPSVRPARGEPSTRGFLGGLGRTAAWDYTPIGAPVFEVPVPEETFEDDPWMRAAPAAAAPAAAAPVRPASPDGARSPTPPAAPSGWLDLD